MNFYTMEFSEENSYFRKFESELVVKTTEYYCWICNSKGQVVTTQSPSLLDRLFGTNRKYSKRVG